MIHKVVVTTSEDLQGKTILLPSLNSLILSEHPENAQSGSQRLLTTMVKDSFDCNQPDCMALTSSTMQLNCEKAILKTADRHRIVIRTQLQTSWSELLVLMRLEILTWATGKSPSVIVFRKNIIPNFSPKDMMDHMNRENTSTRKNLRLSINRLAVNETDNESIATQTEKL